MTEPLPLPFKCPNCDALYEIVQVEADPTSDREINCAVCGGPLPGRDGQFILKYFLLRLSGRGRRRRYAVT